MPQREQVHETGFTEGVQSRETVYSGERSMNYAPTATCGPFRHAVRVVHTGISEMREGDMTSPISEYLCKKIGQ